MSDKPYDLIVLGTGSAGTTVALRCREAGWRVAIADNKPYGGTCALRGCEPKKALWTVVEAADRARRLGSRAGLAGSDTLRVDWPALMAWKRGFTDPVPDARARTYERAGVDALLGPTRFTGPNSIAVGDRELEGRHVLLATGAKPAALPIPGAELLKTSDDFLALDALPPRIVFVGGGYISVESANIAHRAGAAVTILHANDRPLAQFDPDLVARLVAHARRVGIAVELGAEVARIEARGAGVRVHTADGRGFDADMAVHGLGRAPDLDGLNLAAGGIAAEHGRLRLTPSLRSTTNPAVHAAGDVATHGAALTPIASLHAHCVAGNLLDGTDAAPDDHGFASVVFNMPPLAAVGLTEEKAREAGRAFDVHAGDMDGYESVRREGWGDASTLYKVLVERGTRLILGAHLYAPEAHEAINLFALAVRLGLRADDLGQLLSAYPSSGSDIAGMLK